MIADGGQGCSALPHPAQRQNKTFLILCFHIQRLGCKFPPGKMCRQLDPDFLCAARIHIKIIVAVIRSDIQKVHPYIPRKPIRMKADRQFILPAAPSFSLQAGGRQFYPIILIDIRIIIAVLIAALFRKEGEFQIFLERPFRMAFLR